MPNPPRPSSSSSTKPPHELLTSGDPGADRLREASAGDESCRGEKVVGDVRGGGSSDRGDRPSRLSLTRGGLSDSTCSYLKRDRAAFGGGFFSGVNHVQRSNRVFRKDWWRTTVTQRSLQQAVELGVVAGLGDDSGRVIVGAAPAPVLR